MKSDFPWAVYVLRDEFGAIRYVGISKRPEKRLGSHIRDARAATRKNKRHLWISEIVAAGQMPTLEIVEWTCDWDEAERRWVSQCRADGCDLVNGTDGGLDLRSVSARSGSYPQIKYVRNVFAMMLRDMRRAGNRPDLVARMEKTQAAMTAKLRRTRKQGPEAMQALEMVFRQRFHLAPALEKMSGRAA